MVLRSPPASTAAPAGQEPEALIEEARRRARRRRWWVVASVTFVALAVTLADVLWPGSPPPARVATPPPSSGPSAVANWTNLSGSGNGLPSGAFVNSVVGWHGSLVAAGYYFPGAGPVAAGYPGAASPVVWTSGDGGKDWTMTWSPGRVILGSDTVQTLVATGWDLLLFDGGTGGSALWRSTDGHSFEQAQLPPAMSALTVMAATYNEGRVVAELNNKFTGGPVKIYGEGDQLWMSTDGVTWSEAALQGTPVLGPVVATGSGFLVGGQARANGPSTVWVSSDGVSWRTITLPGASAPVLVAASGGAMVGEVAKKNEPALWWSTDGVRWSRSQVSGQLYSYPIGPGWIGRGLFSVPGGFLVTGTPMTTLWFSPTGRQWSKPTVHGGTNPTSLNVQAFLPDSQGLLAEAGMPASAQGGPSFWQVTLTTP